MLSYAGSTPLSRDASSKDDVYDYTTYAQCALDINDIYVLAFNSSNNVLIDQVTDLQFVDNGSDYDKRTIKGRMSPQADGTTVYFAVLANLSQNHIIDANGNTISNLNTYFAEKIKGGSTTSTDIYNNLIFSTTTGKWITQTYDDTNKSWGVSDDPRIPMWGVTSENPFTVGKNAEISGSCSLYRALAKVNIWVGGRNGLPGEDGEFGTEDDFVITKIEVVNANKQGRCVSEQPIDANKDGDQYHDEGPSSYASTLGTDAKHTITYDLTDVTNVMYEIDGEGVSYHAARQAYSDMIYLPEHFNVNGNGEEIDGAVTIKVTYNYNDKKNQVGEIHFTENVIRNHSYIFNIEGVREQMQYTADIKPWSYATKNVEIIVEDFHWLYVKDKVLYMNNINEIKTTFDSSTDDLDYTISDVKVYNTNTAWNNNGGIEINSVTIDKSLKGDITINSVIPDNFVGKEFKVTVSSAISGKSETIQVYQFPPLYLTLQQNSKSVDADNGQTNSSVYEITTLLADLSWLPESGEELELNENFPSGYSHEGDLNQRKTAGTNAINFLKSCKFGYPQTEEIHYNSVTSTIYNKATTVSDIDANTTVETSENGNLISPHFILASQGGANSITNYDNAKQNCAGYSETVKNADGTTTTYGKGTWRVPTKAELILIDLLQNIPKSQVKKILEGETYIYTKNPSDNDYYMMDRRVDNTHAVRCVRDIK